MDELERPTLEMNDMEMSRAPLVETTGAWTCPECTTFNNPNLFPEDANKTACTADEGDGFERFNANKAMSAIIAKNIEVQAARDKHDSLKKAAAEAKKTLDQDEAALGRIISQFARARETQNSPQAMLPLNGQPAAIDSNCPWERAHPGQACIVCLEATRHKLDPDVNSEVHPEHAGHEQVANDAHDAKVLIPLLPKLEAKGFHCDLMDLQALDGDELQQLLDWVDQNGIVPPAILATAHVAAAAGTIAQVCKNCDTLLADANDAEGFYPEGALVGFDCDVKLEQVAQDAIDEVVPDEPVEAARTPKSHAKKNAAKKREPEKERVDQVEAGKKKAAPKSKAAKKGSK